MTKTLTAKGIFWSSEIRTLIRKGIQLVEQNSDHQLVKMIQEYDSIDILTLKKFKVGIVSYYGSQWLAFPYETGIQLYTRLNGQKVIKMVNASHPNESFFRLKNEPKKDVLIIAKSPRETMLLHQRYGEKANVIGLVSGETDLLSQTQEQYLREALQGIRSVYVFLDTDTATAKTIAMKLTSNIAKLTESPAFYVDITNHSGGKYKDVTDAVRDGNGSNYIDSLIENANSVNVPTMSIDEEEILVDDVKPHDTLSDHIYQRLPKSIKDLTGLIDKNYMKDIFLLASLTVISSQLNNVLIEHIDKSYSPDFFALVIASAASGKGFAYKARNLARVLNDHILDRIYSLSSSDSGKHNKTQNMLFLPANSSDRAFYDQLQANKGRGIIFETEIDTMLKAFKQDWGNFSDLLRKAFHHEDLSINRKGDQFIIANPSLSVFLTGTPDQFRNLFQNTENGFYSRFLIYAYSPPYEWQSHQPTKDSKVLEELIIKTSERLYELNTILLNRELPLYVTLNPSQWNLLDSTFEEILMNYFNKGYSDVLISTVKRGAIIALRISAILTMVRLMDEISDSIRTRATVVPQTEDIQTAIDIVTATLEHSRQMYMQELQHRDISYDPFIDSIFIRLPERFTTSEAIQIGESLGCPERTLKRKLSKLISRGRLKKVAHGHYEKVIYTSLN
ncbi:DUF3987 domain-containing protein [Rhodohalobacter sp. 614A]|uniref:DUF3987 domain-containing protein n=1 Tax=Rhodohalobacter sp. 614A TaxID=2908649 RepID=UPI001F24199C|nr:DUF3987 domain-containing protein [Rhodohalobacter sp. 614A]